MEEQLLEVGMLGIEAARRVTEAKKLCDCSAEEVERFFKEYKLIEPQVFNMQDLLRSPKLRLIRTTDRIYFGEVEQKSKSGRGISMYRDGHVFQGICLDNRREGLGVEIFATGNLYVGQFHQNYKHGEGTYYWLNTLHGGQEIALHPPRPTMQYLRGQWQCGNPSGKGIYVKATGDFMNGLKHGQGKQSFKNGDQYEGGYVNGFPEGVGTYRWKSGQYYRGQFRQGFRFGNGEWRGNNFVYKGGFQFDKKCGYGVYKWDSGKIYKGWFWDDQPHGKGVLVENGVETKANFEGGRQVEGERGESARKGTPPRQGGKSQERTADRRCRRDCCRQNPESCLHCHS